ncbi:MAG: fused MFS/spermidine synthase [Terracidiphilus sp.]|nr:fused MFS/spermidine synthase [Terracidiphilus sp.]
MTRMRVLFGGAVFLASFLLFLVEPIAAKQLLPVFGGSAAVWITCLVFFQTALLVAYLYAHWLAHRSHWILHFALLLLAAAAAIAWATQTVDPGRAAQHPVSAIFAALGLSIGLPFLMLGATSPLLQVWLARIETRGIPYRLFALSNLASLLALALYPTVIEPHITLQAQRLIWCCGFAAFALVSAILTWRTSTASSARAPSKAGDESAITPAPAVHKLLWVLLPMGAAMQLAAVTSYLTQNIAAIPLLWILPLAVYLITLILAFQFPRLLPRGIIVRFLVVMLAGLGYMLSQVDVSVPLRIGLSFFLIEVFFACLFCHTEAYTLRPKRTSESTLFYLLFAAGGALGAFLIGIASPLLFSFNYDLALTFFITALLALAVTWSGGWAQRLLWTTASILLLVLVLMLHVAYQRDTPLAVRNFYGSLRVRQSLAAHPGATQRTLTNGTIQHGTQIFTAELRRTPTTYYAEDSGVGLALRFCCQGRSRNIGVVGLGVGTIAAYGKTGDRIRFYEINPAVTPIAQNLFTYLRESGAEISIVEGDARSSLAKEQAQNFEVLVVDAFSGDAIPLHLLTAQAVELYKRHLAPGGILAFHISNQHVDLEPEIALLARDAGMDVRRVSSFANEQRGEFTATWMLATENSNFFTQPEVAERAKQPAEDSRVRLWSDDYSSLLPLIRW